MTSGHGRGLATRLCFVHFGRKAVARANSPIVCFWLKAEVQARLIDVRLCTDNRHCCGEVRFRSY